MLIIEIVTPAIAIRQCEMVGKDIELEAPLHLTWLCDEGEQDAGGRCDGCALCL